MGAVPNPLSQKRLTETIPGRSAALLLALIWIASMSMTDINAYSYLPTLAGLIVVILLALSAMIRGARAVQLSWLAWCSLAIGGYFLGRCLCSFDVVSSWREAGLILCCGVFYVAGIYAAQGRSLKPVVGVLLAAVLLNMAFFFLMRYTDVPMEWTGRPAFGPGGENHRPVTLFVYKNHAGSFLILAGMLLVAAALWSVRGKALRTLLLAVLGVAAVVLSDSCGTRAVLVLAPFMAVLGWILWIALKIHDEDTVSVGVILSGFIILSGIGFGVCALFFDKELMSWAMHIDSNDRYRIWGECCRFLHDAPLWGYGADAVPWLLVSCFEKVAAVINFAHNEYLQVWVDYGLIGLGGMLIILFAHMVRGGLILLSPQTTAAQRRLTALALLCLCGWAAVSFVDFYWHQAAIASMSAFSAGALASPYPVMRRGRLCRVQAQGAAGKGTLAMAGCCIVACCAWLCSLFVPAWEQQWTFNRLSAEAADADGAQRLSIINGLLPQYPSHRLLDTAYTLPGQTPWPEEEQLLKRVLEANPRQIYMVAMLGRLYTEQSRYAEAEALYRRSFAGDGLPRMQNTSWPAFYFYNLILWGQDCWVRGDMPGAYSRMSYALNMLSNAHLPIVYTARYCYDAWSATPEQQAYWKTYLAARKQDVALFKALGVQPDDSWMQPMEPGGKPALYRRYGLADKAERERVADEERRAGRMR